MAKDTTDSDENLIVATTASSKLENRVQRINNIGIVKTRYFAKKIIVFLKFLLKILANANEIKDISISIEIFFKSNARTINGMNKTNFT
jgi:hypothetical protein